MDWHSKPIDDVLKELSSSPQGLSAEEIKERIKRYGYNEIVEKKESRIKMFLRQFSNFLVYILLIATVISFLLGEVVDAVTIMAIVVLMGIMGFAQEYKAEKEVEALKRMLSPKAKVIREGELTEINAREIVPGDVIKLDEGDRVPADARLIESINLEIDESPLTGESLPVEKKAEEVLTLDTPVADRKNMVFMGTYVARGEGKAVVVSTGMNTEVGKIAAKLGEIRRERTPLERELDRFGKKMGFVFLVLMVFIFLIEVIAKSENILNALLLSVALAVAAVPEGLPAIATIILAIGARRMAERRAIVRRLSTIEALGSCNVICSDKTGTITSGEMVVKKIYVDDKDIEVSGSGFEPKGKFFCDSREIDPLKFSNTLKLMLLASLLYNDANLALDRGRWVIKGPPTEGALLVLAKKAGINEEVKVKYPRVRVIPFDRFRKRKTTIHSYEGKYIIFTVGAPEILLENCTTKVMIKGKKVCGDESVQPYIDGEEKELTPSDKIKLLRKIEMYASKGLRTIGFAYKLVENSKILGSDPEDVERDMTFLGFVGMWDPPRPGVKEAIEAARKAGIKVVMVTGDHRVTAVAIAKEIGMEVTEKSVLEGRELENISDEELNEKVDSITVYARVTPEHKARILKALKRKGYIVAMTGDGVNDALALKLADVGIAMGIRGTEVAKEASDLVLADDNFVTIIEAVKEGRTIYENIRKPINYLLTCNFGEVFTVAGADIALLPQILRPAQILWINLLTDALPALGLGLEPPESGIMERPPKRKSGGLITLRDIVNYVTMGGVIALLVILVFNSYLTKGLAYAETVAFTLFVILELIRSLGSRSEEKTVAELPFLGNRYLLIGIVGSLILQLIMIYTPLRFLFKSEVLTLQDIALISSLSIIPLGVNEIIKVLRRKVIDWFLA